MPPQSPHAAAGNAVLLLSCPDRRGLVSRLSLFIFERGAISLTLMNMSILSRDGFSSGFYGALRSFPYLKRSLKRSSVLLLKNWEQAWALRFTGRKSRVAVFVSRYDHCLQELLWRHGIGEFQIEIPLIVSNHPDLQPLADHCGIPFHVIPVSSENRMAVEKQTTALLEAHDVDWVVLARYMQVLSPAFVERWRGRVINIHHSFLPAFVGGNPYRQAYERGVKIIGATSHFITEELDQGPIIEQDTVRVTHRDSLADLIRRGRDLERLVLARAVRLHSEHRILLNGTKTVVFD